MGQLFLRDLKRFAILRDLKRFAILRDLERNKTRRFSQGFNFLAALLNQHR